MIQQIVRFALEKPFLVLIAVFSLIGMSILALMRLNIEAYPNPVPPLVEVIVQPEGMNAEEVERYITVPLEIGLAGMSGLDRISSQSIFGLSDVKCYFKWGTEYARARQEVINRLSFVQLPNQVEAQISPWNATGEIFRYRIEGRGYTLEELKTAQDWILERQFKQVPGVIDVVGYGGKIKQYQVQVDPYLLKGRHVSLGQLLESIANANQNVGGQRLTLGEQVYDVRGIGLIRGIEDIENIVISASQGDPIRVKDIARTQIGHAPRLGMVGFDDQSDIVQGIILMRYGEAALPTLKGVHARIEAIRQNHVLPPGMDIMPLYDRGSLIHLTTKTVFENLVLGMVLVAIVLFLFLGNARAALISALNIPLALLFAICGVVGFNVSANLLSLGAVDFGIVIDSTVIMVENIFRHAGPHTKGTMAERILTAAHEVASPLAFSTLIIAVAFLPIFNMTGVSGVIFSPMAHTYALAIAGAILLALTLTPLLMSRWSLPLATEKEGPLMAFLHRIYRPFFEAAIRRPKRALCLRIIPIVLCGVLFPFLGQEFMPQLEEGNLWVRASLPMSISFEQASKYVEQMRAVIWGCPGTSGEVCVEQNRKHPEVTHVISQLGRSDDGTEVAGFYNVEFFVPLKPFEEWSRGLTKSKLIEQLSQELYQTFPDVIFNFSQCIKDNVEEALSGIKGENSVKVVGTKLHVNEEYAGKIAALMKTVRGIKDVGIFHTLGQPDVRVVPDRVACARYGLNVGDVTSVVQTAIGGKAVTQVFEGEKRFDLTVRWLEPYRSSLDAIRAIHVTNPDGADIPLGQIAEISLQQGPSLIHRENGLRYTPIKFSVRDRDLAGAIAEAREKIRSQIALPYGVRLEWGGEINELRSAEERLKVIIPLTLCLIAFLTYTAVKNWLDTLIVLIDIPVACTGGVLALLVTRTHFSVSAAMGFVSIFGIAIQDAILFVTYFQRLREGAGLPIVEAAREAAEKRFRPVLMTTLVATLGLLPAALSNGIGAQSQKPMAIVVIGGSLILALLTRVLQPPLLVMAHQWLESSSGKRLVPS
ncbi:efflux RND transporter permease subunit [Pajaroellobacter abortibovis]|uniref:Metal transporter n=1 Tax=Pajaroellobacter abortibovis TaxID=1882918 RepID=A0A1L6MV17_9BACT|nr:CusA/CzcA family heavy metal efflux RND transporter [Pajaroellobacter abortibovis]APR99364.1 hypothetical protein BCY86_00725 [Pajaroellobacter abortibovis]